MSVFAFHRKTHRDLRKGKRYENGYRRFRFECDDFDGSGQ